ncbi:MAG TPA: aminotransferase class I/II-fold pyridoxal phosphate-dependent enzyme, partial [Pseudorhizobium sp.]|nr:aminotransferase class I/II-fold pyridoxal phosphate-dependent enzyme [Pseudorhizobium sp.]
KPMLPEGGMFILLDVTATGLTGEQFAWELLKQEDVAVMPGASFGAQAAGFLRISLTVPDDVLVTAMNRIGNLASRLVSSEPKRALA